MISSIKYSEFVFLFNGNLVGSFFGFSEFVNPVSGGFLLGIDSFLLFFSQGSSLFGNDFLSSLSVGSNSFSGGLSLERSVRVKPVHSSGIGKGVSLSIFN